MKKFNLLFSALLGATSLFAQTVESVSVGPSYQEASYYRLSDGQTQELPHANWQFAFSVFGQQDAGIFINEGSSLGGRAVKLHLSSTTDFATTIDPSTDLVQELSNPEQNWSEGAFNTASNSSNFDYGWGSYQMSNHQIVGDKVFVLELSDGSYKKLMIDSLVSGSYYFRYADLDGSNLVQTQVNKADHSGQTLAYYSIDSASTLQAAELYGGWDLLFTRYGTLIDDGQGGQMAYGVTGVLAHKDLEVAEAAGVTPSQVQASSYQDSFATEPLTIVGHDWKSYDFSSGWGVSSDLAYFFRTTDQNIWKVQFIDFEGSSTGVSRLQKENLGPLSIFQAPNAAVKGIKLFPQPARQQNVQLLIEPTQDATYEIQIYNTLGQSIWSKQYNLQQGLQQLELPSAQFSAGQYILQIRQGEQTSALPFLLLD